MKSNIPKHDNHNSPNSPTPMSGSLPRKNNTNNTKRTLATSTSERSTRFEREKEKLKEAAALLDRDENLLKRTTDAAISISKKKLSVIPSPQPQISTPVPSLNNVDKKPTTKKQDQRISTMTDSQIMDKLRKLYYIH